MKTSYNHTHSSGFLFSAASIIFLALLLSCSHKPPQEKGNFESSDLVELVKLDSSFHLDIRYATNNNFTGRPVYTEARAFLQRPAAEALVKVNKELKNYGYGLLIFDAYRPWSVTKLFWDITPRENKKFVANPKKGSRHNRACAVDVSLYELNTGKVAQMTGQYDEMSERSYSNYTGGTEEQCKNRDLLISIMEENGFTVYEYEWWHFDYQGWEKYRIQDIQFSEIK
ncbi:MAG: M15 family metallopeptidase [Bacteroidales bacterium]|nr:M15 family metallopeptidase [Bacteroidales bacterium]MCF8391706.1 M15 family metallopeptidase [Bacteroidales bacterium]